MLLSSSASVNKKFIYLCKKQYLRLSLVKVFESPPQDPTPVAIPEMSIPAV
jgi:hypothetical protein